ncbi:hypothetical protein K2X05_06395 [bacterium]|nr:hypothetical protein [bacterium]
MNFLKYFFISILIASFTIGCTTTSSYIPLKQVPTKSANCPLDIFMPGQKIDKEFELIGTFSVQEMGLSVGCGWDDTLAKNKENACSKGAEAIQFVTVDTPSIHSTCYTSKANFIVYKTYRK